MAAKPASGVDGLLRDFTSLRGLYDSDPVFQSRVDAALEDQETLAERRQWATQLGIGATDTNSIIAALASRLGAKAPGPRQQLPAPKRAAQPAKAEKTGRGGRPRLDTSDLQGKILGALKRGNARGEEIRKRVGLPEKTLWNHAIGALVESKRVKKSGERRATEYRLP